MALHECRVVDQSVKYIFMSQNDKNPIIKIPHERNDHTAAAQLTNRTCRVGLCLVT